MGASSTQGTGAGSAELYNKGAADRQTLGTGHLIGPRSVLSGVATLVSGTPSLATVVFPQALTSGLTYSAQLTVVNANNSAAPTTVVAAYNVTNTGFTIVGSNSSSVQVAWAVFVQAY